MLLQDIFLVWVWKAEGKNEDELRRAALLSSKEEHRAALVRVDSGSGVFANHDGMFEGSVCVRAQECWFGCAAIAPGKESAV